MLRSKLWVCCNIIHIVSLTLLLLNFEFKYYTVLVCLLCSYVDSTAEKILRYKDYRWCIGTFMPLLKDPSTHDVTFKTSDGGSVSAHRVIVAAGSPVFHAMLYGNMKESSQKEIELPNIDSSTLKRLFLFIYTGCAEGTLTQCLDLMLAGDYFGVVALEKLCIHVIENALECSNCCSVATFAVKHHFDALLQSCMLFIECFADSIVDDYLGIDAEPMPLQALIMFLKSDELEVHEVKLFLGVVRWCEQQKNSLSPSDLKSLFELIRYPLISKNDLIKKVHPTKMADQDLYKAALEYHSNGQYNGPEDQTQVRKYYFDFDPVDGLTIEQSVSGTLITKSQLPAGKCATGVFIYPEEEAISFTFNLKACANKQEGKLLLTYEDLSVYDYLDFDEIPLGEMMRGTIDTDDGQVDLLLGRVLLSIPLKESDDTFKYCFIIVLYNEGDQIQFTRT